MRYSQELDSSFGGYSSMSAPDVQYGPVTSYDDGYYGLPYAPAPPPSELQVREENPFYGLLVGPNGGVSRVGPTASVAPRAALDPNVRAGSLFSGGFPTQANFRAGRGYMAQRQSVIAQMAERLRRRRRGLFGR